MADSNVELKEARFNLNKLQQYKDLLCVGFLQDSVLKWKNEAITSKEQGKVDSQEVIRALGQLRSKFQKCGKSVLSS